MSQFDTDLIVSKTVSAMVDVYHEEHKRVAQAYDDLEMAERNLKSVYGDQYSYFSTMPDSRHTNPKEDVLRRIKCNAWRAIINRLEIRKIVSIKRWEALDKQLSHADELPEIGLTAITDMFNAFIQNAQTFTDEAVTEVFDFLRPREHYIGSQYKTNQKNAKFEIGKKIILVGMVQNSFGGGFRVNYHQEQKLVALDKVFSNLDGKLIPGSYESPFVDAVNTTKNGCAETEYFRAKCYQNGNIHLEFKRLDLLQKFNAIAGGANLKG